MLRPTLYSLRSQCPYRCSVRLGYCSVWLGCSVAVGSTNLTLAKTPFRCENRHTGVTIEVITRHKCDVGLLLLKPIAQGLVMRFFVKIITSPLTQAHAMCCN